jgi:hypothetical protein
MTMSLMSQCVNLCIFLVRPSTLLQGLSKLWLTWNFNLRLKKLYQETPREISAEFNGQIEIDNKHNYTRI